MVIVKMTTKRLARFLSLALVALLTVLWQCAVSRQAVRIMPGPWAVVLGIVDLARKGLLVKYVVASLFRVTWGFLPAAVLAIPFGLFLGSYRRAGMAFNPLM